MKFASERFYSRLPISLQNMMVSAYGRRIARDRFGSDTDRMSEFLERSQWFEPDELRAYQEERLQSMVSHSYETVPHYRDVMNERGLRPADIRTAQDLRKLPLLRREDVSANPDRYISTSVKRSSLREVTTSGTTGSPLTVYWDRNVSLMNHACAFRIRKWAGLEFGRPYATLMGRPTVPARQTRPPFWRHNKSWNQLFLSSLHLRDENIPHYLAKMRQMKVEALEAYPSTAYVLARFMEARDEHLPLGCVFVTGEPLLPIERKVIEERFQCKAFDAYSQAERVMYSSECEDHTGQHIFAEYGISEIVDEKGDPVEPGTAGQVVATGLHNYGMPLLRYTFGDVATMSSESCACGRGLPMLAGITTRAEDILVTPDGRLVPPLVVIRGFQIVPGVTESQIIQHRPDEVTVRLAMENPLRKEDEEALRRYLAGRLGPGVRANIERVDRIARTKRGKFRRVISTVPLKWGSTETLNLHDADGESRAFV